MSEIKFRIIPYKEIDGWRYRVEPKRWWLPFWFVQEYTKTKEDALTCIKYRCVEYDSTGTEILNDNSFVAEPKKGNWR